MTRQNKGPQEDLRQRRSKRHMSQALLGLMEERPFREISVVDICDRAMVHRTTFYAHFEDKNALLRHVLNELQRSFWEKQGTPDEHPDMRSYLLTEFYSALTFLKDHRQIYLSGLAGGSAGLRLVEDTISEGLAKRFREADPRSAEKMAADMAGRFYSGALMSVVRWWLENDMPISEEELLEQFKNLLPPVSAGGI